MAEGLNLAHDYEPSDGQRQAYIVDDNPDLRLSMSFLLETIGIKLRPFENGEIFLGCLADLMPAPILLDIRMAGIDGMGVLTELAARQVKWPVIMMTGHGDIAIAVKSMKLGAIEFLEKPFEPEALEISLMRAFDVLAEMRESLQGQLAARQQLATLTPRENDVIRSLVDGAPNKIVAYQLGLSPRTVEMHRANAFAKLGLKSIAELVKLINAADAPRN